MMDFFAPTLPITDEQLIGLRKHWTAQRASYPGWVITPYDNRERVWNFTRRWILGVLQMSERLNPPEDILLLFELNWRLERCMMPLFLDWVEKITAVVERYQPFGASAKAPNLVIAPEVEKHSHLPWEHLTEIWINLVFALAREAREDQDSVRFEKWMGMAEASKPLRPEWAAKWHHEKSLFALMRLDRAAVVKAIEQWPRTRDEPFWEARRAAILAETGSFSEAEQLAEAALEKIRSRLRPFTNDFTALSQEGWVMLLLDAIRQAKDMTRPWVQRRQFISRWDQLKAYGSDPWQEFNLLDLALQSEPPAELPALRVHRGFDPGQENRTLHYSSEPAEWKALPAFALLRLYEEAAVPLNLGTLSIHSDAAARAARWLSAYAPLWSLSTIVRVGKDDEIKNAFSRSLIAALTAQQIESFYHLVKPPLEAVLSATWSNWQEAHSDINYRLIKPNTELLSRLYFRLPQAQRDETFSLACQMYRSAAFRRDFTLHDPLRELFRRIIYGMSDEELSNHIGEFLDLPTSIEATDPFDARRWVEPTVFINPRTHNSGAFQAKHADLVDSIERLQQLVRSGSPHERPRAVSRLSALDSLNALNDNERLAFAEGLWMRLDPLKHLPAETYMTDYSFLHLPEPSPGRAKEMLAAYLLQNNVPPIATTTADGRLQYSMPVGNDASRFVENVVGATIPLAPKEPARFIDWTPEQASLFLDKVAKWWAQEKELLGKVSPGDELHTGILAVFEQMLEVFAHVILPRLPKARYSSDASRALEVLQEMGNAGVPLLGISPTLLFAEPELAEKVAEDIRAGLTAKAENTVRRAIFAVQAWALLPIRNDPPVSVPADLIEELVDRIFFRVPPALPSALATTGDIIHHIPALFGPPIVKKLLQALEQLVIETEISSLRSEASEPSEERIIISPEERPSCRRYAAFLAANLSNTLTKVGEVLPPVLQTWDRIGNEDPLPEVRRAWDTEIRRRGSGLDADLVR
jgi:hypothetical protein